ncbi:MAG: diaminopimelate decarboxylase [Syntrophaceae bacterium]|nr:diaminopimelate decarboxylase [Syntrophaceae bacterium]
MNHFHYRGDEFWCEDVPIRKIAEKVGTPFYLYSSETLRHHFRVFDEAFSSVPHMICFSVKSNANIAVLSQFIQLGSGVDIVSGGELYRANKAGVNPDKVVYSGVGKRIDEIEDALKAGILMFNVESSQELQAIHQCAKRLGKKAGIALRINPDVDPQTHPYISTGLKDNKFGFQIEKAIGEYLSARDLPHCEIKGVSCHIGSQITKLAPFLDTMKQLRELIVLLKKNSIGIRYLDLGGGLGINYSEENPPDPTEYAKNVISVVGDVGCTFILEPGRVLVGNAGIMVTKVLYTKANKGKNFIVVDAGMNDLIRPALYNSYHQINVVVRNRRKQITADIVGPICESSDYLAKGRSIEQTERGDLLAVMSSGAYCFSMASNYNSRPRIPELLVKDNLFYIIRKREDYQDLTRGEKVPAFLRCRK